MAKKSMILALVISFILTGLGMAYTGEWKKGVVIFIVAMIINALYLYVFKTGAIALILGLIVIIVWIYGLYATYVSCKAVNAAAE